MKLRWTIILLVLNVLLIGVFARQWTHPASVRAFERQSRTFLPLEKGDWEAVAVEREGVSWRASRDRWGQWWLKTPVEWPARTDKMAKMMGYLLGLKVESSFLVSDLKRVGQNLKSYGLETPSATLTVTSAIATHAYKIGSVTPLGGKLYVLSADEKEIWVVDGGLREYADWNFEDLRQDRFYPFEVAELEGMEIQLADTVMTFARGSGEWVWQLGGKTLSAEPGVVDQWIVSVGGLNVAKFEKLSADAQGLRIPYGRIIFKTLYGRRALLIGAGAAEGTRWAQWEGAKTAFEIPQSVIDRLAPSKLLPTHPFTFHTDEINAVEVKMPRNAWKLQKLENGRWTADGKTLDTAAVEAWLLDLARMVGSSGVSAGSAGPYYIQLQQNSGMQRLELAADLQTASLPVGNIGYRLSQPIGDVGVENFWDKHFLSVAWGAEITAQWVDNATGLVTAVPKDSAQMSALVVLLKDAQVGSWRQDPQTKFAYALKIADAQTSLTIAATPEANGWVGSVEGASFEFDKPWCALLDILCKKPQQQQ